MRVLTVNAGSSSLKLRLLGTDDQVLASADLPAAAGSFDPAAVTEILSGWPPADAAGHRVVHGGTEFTGPVRITAAVEDRLRQLTDLAPLHQPKSLAGLDAVSAALPGLPAVACFDTAFHTTIPAEAATYAIPERWREEYGIRRYGFHGRSPGYAAARAAELPGKPLTGTRIVSCHLGAGASLCAVVDGRSADTTMGFTPLEGLVMATRSGTIDPGIVLWLAERQHLTTAEIATALEQRSGLLALAGTGDMREVEHLADKGDPRAELALRTYLHRLTAGIASMAAAAGGLDLLAFTGGVGEHSPLIRAEATRRLAWLGVAIDDDANSAVAGDAVITGAGARIPAVVVTAREDLQIARETRRALRPGPP